MSGASEAKSEAFLKLFFDCLRQYHMLDQIDRDTPKDRQLLAMKALDLRLAEIGGGGYVGLGFKLRGLKACGFDDQGWPNPLQKFMAYQKAIEILNQLGDSATAEDFMQAATVQPIDR